MFDFVGSAKAILDSPVAQDLTGSLVARASEKLGVRPTLALSNTQKANLAAVGTTERPATIAPTADALQAKQAAGSSLMGWLRKPIVWVVVAVVVVGAVLMRKR